MKNKVVMLVDDNKIDNFVTQKILEKAEVGGSFIVVDTVKEALRILDSNKDDVENLPDFIFLDINMPAISGFDFLSHYENFPATLKNKCKIIVLSSSEKDEDMARMLKNELVTSYIPKPLTNEVLARLKRKLT
jgi:CheY-like chemotaxis protein